MERIRFSELPEALKDQAVREAIDLLWPAKDFKTKAEFIRLLESHGNKAWQKVMQEEITFYADMWQEVTTELGRKRLNKIWEEEQKHGLEFDPLEPENFGSWTTHQTISQRSFYGSGGGTYLFSHPGKEHSIENLPEDHSVRIMHETFAKCPDRQFQDIEGRAFRVSIVHPGPDRPGFMAEFMPQKKVGNKTEDPFQMDLRMALLIHQIEMTQVDHEFVAFYFIQHKAEEFEDRQSRYAWRVWWKTDTAATLPKTVFNVVMKGLGLNPEDPLLAS